jgi:hypothetical protein
MIHSLVSWGPGFLRGTSRGRGSAILGTAFVLLVSREAPCQSTDDHSRAVAAFQEARSLIEAGHCEQAIPKLQASLTFEPSIGANLSLADCYETTDPLAAWKQLKEAQRLAYIKHDDRMTAAQHRAAALEPRLAVVRVIMPAVAMDLPGLEIRIDGNILDRFYYGDGGAIAVYPGRHRLTVTAPSKTPWTLTFEASQDNPVAASPRLEDTVPASTAPLPPLARESANANAPAPFAPAEPLPPAPQERGEGTSRRTVGLVLGGVGLAGLAAGIVTGAFVFAEKGSLETLCNDRYPQCGSMATSANHDYSTARSLGVVSDVGFIAGGAALVTGAVLYLSAPRSRSPAAALRVSPLGVLGGGLEITRAW